MEPIRCGGEFDTSEDDEKDLKRRIGGLETKITEAEEAIATLTDELAALKLSIRDLDKAVSRGRRCEDAVLIHSSGTAPAS